MLEELSQETVTEYANEALTIQEPQGTDYTQGVKVGKTIPAKWWNWLFNAVTKRLGQSKTDAQGILSELQNTVTDAGIELDSSDNTQLSQAVAAKTDIQINNYINKKRWYYSYWHKTSQKLLLLNSSGSETMSHYDNQGYGVCYIDWDGNKQIQNCSVCIDGTQWYEVPVAQYTMKWYKWVPKCVFFKFKDTYVLTIQYFYKIDGSESTVHSYLMLVSKDALNWTSVAPFGPIFHEVKGVQFFICDDTLYALAGYNAPGYSARSGLYYTTDITDWGFKAMSYDVMAPDIDFVYLSHAYKFGTKYLVGNSTFDPVTKEFTVLTAERYPNAGDRGYVLNGNTAFVPAVQIGSGRFYRVTSDGTSTLINGTLGDPSTDYKVIVNTETVSRLRRLSFSYDGENIIGTLETQSPLSSCVYVNGYYYVANQRTTDFVNWEPIPNLPQGTFITATGFDNILAVVDSNRKRLKYVSYDYAANWVPVTVEAYSVNDELVDGYIEAPPTLVHTGNIYFTGQLCLYWPASGGIIYTLVIYTISDSINHVIGHTLYLR